MPALKIGADPEFFVRRKAHYVPGHIFPCGTKKAPVATCHGHVQVDGIALEVNVRPAETRDEFIRNVRGVMADVTEIMQKTMPGAELLSKPSVYIGGSKLAGLPLENFILGCEPDFNAWNNNRINPRPNPEMPIRTGSGHIHIGWTENQNPHNIKHMLQCGKVVRQLDYYLGLPSLLWDGDSRRRTLYGKAGAFRPKPYGVEYRVLSNAWVTTDNLIGWVFDRTVQAVTDLWAGKDMVGKYGQAAAQFIDNNTTDWRSRSRSLAKEILV